MKTRLITFQSALVKAVPTPTLVELGGHLGISPARQHAPQIDVLLGRHDVDLISFG